MNRKSYLANAILWASAIIASAILGAPAFFTLVLLPVLASTALVTTWSRAGTAPCQT